jgi:pimeloyl-ACP methyl ester carboxylesterase
MNGTRISHLNLDGEKVYYEIGGSGKALVFNHAGFVDSGMWDGQWNEFSRHYQVIRYDMRGFGRSAPLQHPVSRRQDLHRLLKHLSIERATLVGVSLGGEVAIDFALEYPEMVEALAVVSTVPGGFELQGEPPPGVLEMIAALQGGDLARASEVQIRLWVDGSFRQPDQVDPSLRRFAAEMNRTALEKGAWGPASAQPLNPLDPPAARRLKELQIPVLIVAGALDHPEILRAASYMEAEIKDASRVILPDSAHVPTMEKPVEFNQALEKFLSGLP